MYSTIVKSIKATVIQLNTVQVWQKHYRSNTKPVKKHAEL